ncbi:MAG: neutral/alkaline non-lysosomal ceramidase N-terminal domain-containing protein [Planctomycetes bacterium]|nr:neutral/alkaline non-lysosomal ceramidase N-terminal domain-containing protein [Planctomycetota bacterium]
MYPLIMMRIFTYFIVSFSIFCMVSSCTNAPIADSEREVLEPRVVKAILKVGAAKVDVTPDLINLKVTLAGKSGIRTATGLLDPLFVRAIVIKSSMKKIGIVSMEQLFITTQMYKTIVKRVEKIGFTSIIVQATQTHSGDGHFSHNFIEQRFRTGKFHAASFEKRVIAAEIALRTADETAEEAQLVLESTRAEFNMNNQTVPFYVNKTASSNAGDTTFERLMFFSKENKALICQMINLPANPMILCVKNTKISGDLPGRLSKIAENEYPHSVATVLNNATDDFIPNDKVLNIFLKSDDIDENLEFYANRLYRRFYPRKKINSTVDWEKSWQYFQHEDFGSFVRATFDDTDVFEINEIEVKTTSEHMQIITLGKLAIATIPGKFSALHAKEFYEYAKIMNLAYAWYLPSFYD